MISARREVFKMYTNTRGTENGAVKQSICVPFFSAGAWLRLAITTVQTVCLTLLFGSRC